MKLKRLVKCLGCCVLIMFCLHQGLVMIFPFPMEMLHEETQRHGKLILDVHGDMIDRRVGSHGQYSFPIEKEAMGMHIQQATIAAEDDRFYEHAGVDYASLTRALFQNIQYGKRLSGASTISMQLVRLMMRQPRTWFQKGLETWYAIQLEKKLSKDEILKHYLNLAPYGGNIVGIEAAAQIYFNKSAINLSLGEAALLAGIPQSPNRFNPKKNLERAMTRRRYVLRRLQELEMVSHDEIEQVLSQRVHIHTQHEFKRNIQLAEQWMAIVPGKRNIYRTTLDPSIQARVNEEVMDRRMELKAHGVDGLAVVVLDVKNSKLIAQVGAVDDSTMINLAQVRRQPASTLKTFLYAQAYDEGWLTPEKLVSDRAMHWGDYRPRNVDHTFMGDIQTKDALFLSRNIPAVYVIHRLGVNRFMKTLKALNLGIDLHQKDLGLSLALGTPECRLIDLANAYAVLLRGGQYHSLKVLEDQSFEERQRIFSPQASAMTLYSLGARQGDGHWQMASKTGTSWQQRDAWAIAMSPSKVVAVWLGLLNGRGHHVLKGADEALPLAQHIIQSISESNEEWTLLKTMSKRKICDQSGLPKSHQCKAWKWGHYIKGKSHALPCHKRHKKSNQETIVSVKQKNLAIQAPIPNSDYIFRKKHDDEQTLLMRMKDNPNQTLYWFLNGKMVRETKPKQHTWEWRLRPGDYKLLVCNESGESQNVSFAVSEL